VQRGHHVDVRTLASGVPVARSTGCVASPIDPRIEAIEMTDWKVKTGKPALKVAFGVFAQRAAVEVDDLREAITATRPDAVVVDANCWGGAVAAEASGVPWLAFWPYFPFLRSPGIPPFGPGLRPWPGLAGRIRDRLLDPVVTGQLTTLMLPPVNDLRREMGLPRVGSVDELLRCAPLMLVASSAPLDYPRSDTAGRLHMIGPCEFDPSLTGDSGWLDDIDGPLILVTMSSERQGDVALGVTAVAALADLPVHVIATFPAGVPPGMVLPANASAVRFVSHAAVLDRAICAVTHGGMGGTQKALARGVPVCVVPHGRDQFEVARRVEVAGCGTRLPASRLTAPRLKAKTLQAISMTEGARRVAEGFIAAGGVRRGADVLEKRLLTG
jgi:MGT family glycosyltransferase